MDGGGAGGTVGGSGSGAGGGAGGGWSRAVVPVYRLRGPRPAFKPRIFCIIRSRS